MPERRTWGLGKVCRHKCRWRMDVIVGGGGNSIPIVSPFLMK